MALAAEMLCAHVARLMYCVSGGGAASGGGPVHLVVRIHFLVLQVHTCARVTVSGV